jgi:hypothetical protein
MLEFLGHPLKENGNWVVTVPPQIVANGAKGWDYCLVG